VKPSRSRREGPWWVRRSACGGLLHRPRRHGAGARYFYFEDEPGRHSAAKLLAKASPLRLIRYVWSSTGPLCPRCSKGRIND
jgi:hypothetical protein